MIEARAINKSYGSLQAVQDLSFKTEPGRVFGIIGPNGAGKSTTIRMLMNIISPDSGEILIEDKPFSEEDKDRIGYLPEERGLYKKVKVGEALLYCAALKGKKRREAEPEIDRWLERFDLQDWKNRKIEELSKGMAQKVQFISAVVHKPD
ncbi:MAG: ATP-binding cassette domain-containing protein, partial [Spirochaetes bacterium]|nr:ATP-binding cassette domain-containing protein [Spirochaetota bacterium]